MESNKFTSPEYFLYSYPEDRLQSELPTKGEYNQLKVYRKDLRDPINGNFTQQTFAHRFMLNYDRLLLLWEAGSGKTWGGLGAAEQFRLMKEHYENNYLKYTDFYFERVHYYVKIAYIVVKNKNLIPVFRDTIFEKTPIKSKTELKKYYKLTTYTNFFKLIKNMKKEDMIRTFSNTFIMVDEAHNLKPSASGVEDDENKGITHRERYKAFLKLFRTVSNMKLILMTATPMIDNVREAGYLFNLILPPDAPDMPVTATKYYNARKDAPLSSELKLKPQDVEKWFKNIISYVGIPDIGVELVYQGRNIYFQYEDAIDLNDPFLEKRLYEIPAEEIEDIENLDEEGESLYLIKLATVVKRAYMSGIQLEVYIQEYLPQELQISELTNEEIASKRSSFHNNMFKLVNFVFPDGSYGDKAILKNKEYVEMYKNGKKITSQSSDYDQLEFTARFKQNYTRITQGGDFQLLDNDLSAKFNEILTIIAEKDTQKVPGIIYIFFPNLKKYGAMILEALVRLILGYSRYGGKNVDRKKKRVTLISGETRNAQEIIDQLNQEQNYKGEYIRMIITTKAIGEGYSLKNVTTIIQAEATWNESTSYQAIRRGYRAKGFDSKLLNEYQNLQVSVYKVVSTINVKDLKGEDDDKENDESETTEKLEDDVEDLTTLIDAGSFEIDVYFAAEHKDWYIKRLKRYMEKYAVDCHLNKARNILPKRLDYTANCDYDQCQYECIEAKNGSIEYQSYGLLYSDLYIDSIQQQLFEEIKIKPILSLNAFIKNDKILSLKIPSEIILEALNRILKSKPIVADRYGFQKTIYEDNGYFYLDDIVAPQYEDYNNSIYNQYLHIDDQRSLKNILEAEIEDMIKNRIMKVTPDDFEDFFYNSTVTARAILLQNHLQKRYHLKVDALIDKYMRGYYIKMNEPLLLISYVQSALDESGKRGREPTDFRKISTQQWEQMKYNARKGKVGSKVYVHYIFMFNEPKASRTSGLERFKGNLRIWKPPEQWRITNHYEEEVYSRIIDDNITQSKDTFVKSKRGHFLLDRYSPQKTKYTSLEPIYIIHYNFNRDKLIVVPSWFSGKTHPSYPTAVTANEVYLLIEKKIKAKMEWNRNEPDRIYEEYFRNKILNRETKNNIETTQIVSEGKRKSGNIEFDAFDHQPRFISKNEIKEIKNYYIHGKNGTPFLVTISFDAISIYTYSNAIEEKNFNYTKLIKIIPSFEGYWAAYDPTIYAYHGNALLVKVKNFNYILISYEIYSFNTKEEIIDFVSPVGVEYDPFLDKRKISRGTDFEGLPKPTLKQLVHYFGIEVKKNKDILSKIYQFMEDKDLILYI